MELWWCFSVHLTSYITINHENSNCSCLSPPLLASLPYSRIHYVKLYRDVNLVESFLLRHSFVVTKYLLQQLISPIQGWRPVVLWPTKSWAGSCTCDCEALASLLTNQLAGNNSDNFGTLNTALLQFDMHTDSSLVNQTYSVGSRDYDISRAI